MADSEFQIVFTPDAREMLLRTRDRRHLRVLQERIEGLKREPDKQGKPLTGDLKGFRSLRAVGQRYRIIYAVSDATVTVFVVAVGMREDGSRKDVYRMGQRLADEAKKWIRGVLGRSRRTGG